MCLVLIQFGWCARCFIGEKRKKEKIEKERTKATSCILLIDPKTENLFVLIWNVKKFKLRIAFEMGFQTERDIYWEGDKQKTVRIHECMKLSLCEWIPVICNWIWNTWRFLHTKKARRKTHGGTYGSYWKANAKESFRWRRRFGMAVTTLQYHHTKKEVRSKWV